MEDKHRLLKWVVIVFLVATALMVLIPPQERLKGGIDLVGGTSLLFEIDTTGMTPIQKRDLAERVIAILRNRVDPNNQMNLVWRPIGSTRIEVQMPQPPAHALARRRAYEQAREAVREKNVSRMEVDAALNTPPAERDAALAALEIGVSERVTLLTEAATALDNFRAVKGTDDVDAEFETMNAYEAAVDAVLDTSVNLGRLTDVLELNPRERQDELARLVEDHPAYQAEIEAVASEYENWAKDKGAMEDPADLKRRIRGAGVLEFRILAERDAQDPLATRDIGRPIKDYTEQLEKRGPRMKEPGDPFRWYPVKDIKDFMNATTDTELQEFLTSSNIIVHPYLGTYYVLTHDDPQKYGLTKESGRWELRTATPSRDYRTGRPSVDFTLDARGGSRFGELTRNNLKRQLAIFLDGVCQSHATIQSQIYSRGQISGNFSQQEVTDLVNTLEAGSLPARVKETPLMEKTVGPSLGEANRRDGMRAALFGLISVAVFILIYYLFAGVVANIALALNLIFVLSIMAMLEATFTLPGIAGLILTVGMAVDANVLIFERFREERERGVILKKALKTAYEKAFSTIVDANLTTLITCVILGYVGSEEVKGFAMTLGFGVVTSMFTALFVTRVIFTTLISAGWIKSLPMLRLIGHPNIHWLQMRKLFWPVSSVLVVAGIGLFTYVSITDKEAIYDIEFLGGTSVQIEMQSGVAMNDQEVREKITAREDSAASWLEGAADALASGTVEAAATQGDFVITSDRLTGDQMAVLLKTTFEDRIARDGITATGNRLEVVTKPSIEKKEDGSTVDVNMTLEEFQAALVTAADYVRKAATDRLSSARVQTVRDVGAAVDSPTAFEIVTVETNRELVQTAIVAVLGEQLLVQLPVEATLVKDPNKAPDGFFPIVEGTRYLEDVVPGGKTQDIQKFVGGLVLVFDGIDPPQTTQEIKNRIKEIRLQPEYEDFAYRESDVFGLTPEGQRGEEPTFRKIALVVMDENVFYDDSNPEPWREALAEPELQQAEAAFASEKTLRKVLQFDSPVARRTQNQATLAMILAFGAIVAYVWIRFGTMQYGLAAIVALVHDVSITLGLVTLVDTLGLTGESMRIDLAMIAAILTIIGYSLNDTIVVFDRIRENRGKLTRISTEMINTSINQCLSRTVLTSLTTFLAVFILFVWGGPGVHGFSFALMIGVIVGTYSSVGIAAPLLNSPRALHLVVYVLIAAGLFGIVAQIVPNVQSLVIGGAFVLALLIVAIVIDRRSHRDTMPARA